MPKEGFLSNEKAQAELRTREKDEAKLLVNNIREVASTQQGRFVLSWLIYDRCRFGEHRFDPSNAHATYVLGLQSIGQALVEHLEDHHPEQFDALRKEYRLRVKQRELLNTTAKVKAEAEPEEEQPNA